MISFWVGLLGRDHFAVCFARRLRLGVGILFVFADEPNRRKMLSAISPVWDGNEPGWL